jgi:hypothetical protein
MGFVVKAYALGCLRPLNLRVMKLDEIRNWGANAEGIRWVRGSRTGPDSVKLPIHRKARRCRYIRGDRDGSGKEQLRTVLLGAAVAVL